jgi:hypothetical protein
VAHGTLDVAAYGRPPAIRSRCRVCNVDVDLLEEQRIGTVIPLEDRIEDAYDRGLRCSDLPEQVPEADVAGGPQSTRRAASPTGHAGAEAGRAGV